MKQHYAKAGPSLCVILSSVLQLSGYAALWPSLSSRLARLHMLFLFFLIFPVFLLLIIGHGERLLSSPRGIVTYGNALGIRQMSGQNSRQRLRMHSDRIISHIC